MPKSLQPKLRNGIIRWTRTAITLHIVWGYQFVIALVLEYCAFIGLFFSVFGQDHDPYDTRVFFCIPLNSLFVGVTVAEICLYANGGLTPNIYLFSQVGKLIYVLLVVLVGGVAYGGLEVFEGSRWKFWFGVILGIVYFLPWVLGAGRAVLVKVRERRDEKELKDLVQGLDEETPLLR